MPKIKINNIRYGYKKKIAMKKVKKCGYSLRSLAYQFKNDKDVVMEAVKQNGYFYNMLVKI